MSSLTSTHGRLLSLAGLGSLVAAPSAIAASIQITQLNQNFESGYSAANQLARNVGSNTWSSPFVGQSISAFYSYTWAQGSYTYASGYYSYGAVQKSATGYMYGEATSGDIFGRATVTQTQDLGSPDGTHYMWGTRTNSGGGYTSYTGNQVMAVQTGQTVFLGTQSVDNTYNNNDTRSAQSVYYINDAPGVNHGAVTPSWTLIDGSGYDLDSAVGSAAVTEGTSLDLSYLAGSVFGRSGFSNGIMNLGSPYADGFGLDVGLWVNGNLVSSATAAGLFAANALASDTYLSAGNFGNPFLLETLGLGGQSVNLSLTASLWHDAYGDVGQYLGREGLGSSAWSQAFDVRRATVPDAGNSALMLFGALVLLKTVRRRIAA